MLRPTHATTAESLPLCALWLPASLLPWLVLAALPLRTQPLQVLDHAPETYLGAEACSACHAEQSRTQAASGHARSLVRVAGHELASSFVPSGPLARNGGISYSYHIDGVDLEVEAGTPDARLGLRLQWAFGAGEQAVTFVGQVDEHHYVEHHNSYYTATDSLATTPGHSDRPPQRAADSFGMLYETFGPEPAIMRCFQCHSTGPLTLGEGFSLRPAETGVRCEVCHGPGRPHVESVASGAMERARAVIGNPGRLSGDDLLKFCGACHRPPASSGQVVDWSDPWNVRHQPVYLARSACVQPSGQPLTCMRCHDPHRPLLREAARDNRLCLDCHTVSSRPAAVCHQATDKTCASCHMPTVKPQDNLRFTNHWIGVYNGGRPLRPREPGVRVQGLLR